MSNASQEIIERINDLTKGLFAAQVSLDAKNDAFLAEQAAANARHNADIAPIQAAIDTAKEQLAELVESHRDSLIKPGRKSFVTMIAKFQFLGTSTKSKILDVKGLMARARDLHVVRKVARPTVVWKPDLQKLVDWLQKNSEYRQEFDEFIQQASKGESLSVKPNGTYVVVHDGSRISPPPVTLKSWPR